MNILSYDYHSAFESAVNHHSPLYPIGEDDEYNFEAALSIVSIASGSSTCWLLARDV